MLEEKFWQAGETLQSNGHVILRKVKETDREMFLELQRETSMMRSMLKEEGYRLMHYIQYLVSSISHAILLQFPNTPLKDY